MCIRDSPNYVQWLVDAAAKHPEASIFQPGVVVIDENNGLSNTLVEQTKAFYRPKGEAVLQGEELATSLLRGAWFYFPSLGWRKDAIVGTGFREGLNVIQDMALILDITMRGGSLYYDPQIAFMYRRHGGSDSSWRALEGTRFEEERRYYKMCIRDSPRSNQHSPPPSAPAHTTCHQHKNARVPHGVPGQFL